MTNLMTAEEVQARLKVKSRAKAIELMERLPHINLAKAGARQRQLRITTDTLEAFMQGKLSLDETNVIPMPKRKKENAHIARGGRKQIPEIIPLRR